MIAYDDNDRGSSDEHLDDFDDDEEEDTSDDDDDADADADADVVTPSPIGTVNVPLRTLAAARDLERSMRSPRASLATPPRNKPSADGGILPFLIVRTSPDLTCMHPPCLLESCSQP